MKDDSGQLRALQEGEALAPTPTDLSGLAETFLWMLGGLLLDMGIRAIWLRAAIDMPSWGGLFLDMTGVMVVGLARGQGAACGVVVLNQIYRMAFGQVSNAFVLVEVAGALVWGAMAARGVVVLDRRRPLRLLGTFLVAAVGGGVACALVTVAPIASPLTKCRV